MSRVIDSDTYRYQNMYSTVDNELLHGGRGMSRNDRDSKNTDTPPPLIKPNTSLTQYK